MRFWSEIILVISNQTHAVHLFDFEIMHLILGQIVLHSITIINPRFERVNKASEIKTVW